MATKSELYAEIHALTHRACEVCPNEAARLPNRCCDPIGCANAKKWAAIKGVTVQATGHRTLPFMATDKSGCTLDIKLKPLCTMHHCANLDGDAHYLELRRWIENLEGEDWKRYLASL